MFEPEPDLKDAWASVHLAALPGRPYLMIGATDLSTGTVFDFTSEQLGRLCSSIDRVPLAFAVAASSAVPLLFSPLTLHSHRGSARRGAKRPSNRMARPCPGASCSSP